PSLTSHPPWPGKKIVSGIKRFLRPEVALKEGGRKRARLFPCPLPPVGRQDRRDPDGPLVSLPPSLLSGDEVEGALGDLGLIVLVVGGVLDVDGGEVQAHR